MTKETKKVKNALYAEIEALPDKSKGTLATRANITAAWYLRRHNYVILDTDWKCNFGTVDIVAMDNDCLAFIEVKYKRNSDGSFPCESITKKKRKKYENIALAYVVCHDYSDLPMRFDVIDVVMLDGDRCVIKQHVNAMGSSQAETNDLETINKVFKNKSSDEIVNLLAEYEKTYAKEKPVIYRAYQKHLTDLVRENFNDYINRLIDTNSEHPTLKRYESMSANDIESFIESTADDLEDHFYDSFYNEITCVVDMTI